MQIEGDKRVAIIIRLSDVINWNCFMIRKRKYGRNGCCGPFQIENNCVLGLFAVAFQWRFELRRKVIRIENSIVCELKI